MNSEQRPGAESRERGFALLIVLWIFIVLIAIGAEFSGAMREDAAATMNFAGGTQSYYLATAAASRTFYRALIARDEAKLELSEMELEEMEEEPLVRIDGQWHQENLWGAPVWVKISDESGKIPINMASEGLLRTIMSNLGLDAEEADEIASSILDWRDPDDDVRVNGAESEYYLDRPRPYLAKNARLDALEELLLVKGVSREIFRGSTDRVPVGLREIFTVFNPQAFLNVRSAPPAVLKALLGLDDEQITQLEELRATTDLGVFGLVETLLSDPALSELLIDEPPNILRVEVQAQMPDSPVAAHIAAIVDLGESSDGIYILRWYDDLPAADLSRAASEFDEEAA